MGVYNAYLDASIYTGKMDLSQEVIPQNASFKCYDGEKCIYSTSTCANFAEVLKNLESNNIDALDKKIVSLVATYGFMTSKQITEFLTLLDIKINSLNLKNNLDRLLKNQMLCSFRFGANEYDTANYIVYCLNKNGSELAKALCVSHNYTPFNRGMYPSDIKRILEINQICASFLKSDLSVEWMKRGPVISVKTDKDAVARPSYTVCANGDVMMFEVVRKGDYWKNRLREKLGRYKMIFDNWSANSWNLPDDTCTLIINGENLEHNLEIHEVTFEMGLQTMFTEDLLQCGSSFYRSIYEFDSSKQPIFYEYNIEA